MQEMYVKVPAANDFYKYFYKREVILEEQHEQYPTHTLLAKPNTRTPTGKAGPGPDSHEFTKEEYDKFVDFMEEMVPHIASLPGFPKEMDLSKGFAAWMNKPCDYVN